MWKSLGYASEQLWDERGTIFKKFYPQNYTQPNHPVYPQVEHRGYAFISI
jgi:hypothetical protein